MRKAKKQRRPNQNLTLIEAQIKRQVAECHGYTISRGPMKDQGSALQLDLGIIYGEVATILLDESIRNDVIAWIQPQLAALVQKEPSVAEGLASIIVSLIDARDRQQAADEAELRSFIK